MPALIPPVTPGHIDDDFLADLVGRPSSVILEIGAHDGNSTRIFLKKFPEVRIYAFEPDPRALEKFRRNVKDPRVSLFATAIGAVDGEIEFYQSGGLPPVMSAKEKAEYPQGWDRSSSIRRPKNHKVFWPWVKFDQKITVPVKRLDTWLKESGLAQIDMIWADTQGAEGDLIAGGLEALGKTRFFYTEYSNVECYEGQPTLQQIMEMLPRFEIVCRFDEDVLLRNTAIA